MRVLQHQQHALEAYCIPDWSRRSSGYESRRSASLLGHNNSCRLRTSFNVLDEPACGLPTMEISRAGAHCPPYIVDRSERIVFGIDEAEAVAPSMLDKDKTAKARKNAAKANAKALRDTAARIKAQAKAVEEEYTATLQRERKARKSLFGNSLATSKDDRGLPEAEKYRDVDNPGTLQTIPRYAAYMMGMTETFLRKAAGLFNFEGKFQKSIGDSRLKMLNPLGAVSLS